MTELKVLNETVDFMGFKLPVIEGGFGEGQRLLTEVQVARIHNMEVKEVRKSIKRLLDSRRLKLNIDFIDIKPQVNSLPMDLESTFGVKPEYLSRTENIFILSERGYTKLVKSMDDDESWDVMDRIVEGYFKYRKIATASYMIEDPIKRAEKWIEEQRQIKLLLEQKDNKIETQHKLIDTMTETYDGTYIRFVCTDYVNKVARESGRHQADLYSDLYKLTGRKLKSDLTVQFEKFVKSEKEKVKANAEYNRENSLKGLDRKTPFLIKDSKAGISKIEFICDVLGKGSVLLEVMAKVFEVGITDIVAKYNIIAESEKIKIEY